MPEARITTTVAALVLAPLAIITRGNFCMWMAGGGVKPGISFGETDDFSYNVVDSPVHLNDLNATIMHCMGIDHERFTHKVQGLDVKLTGVEPARVVKQLLA